MGSVPDNRSIFVTNPVHEHPAVAEVMLQLNTQDRGVAHEVGEATEAAQLSASITHEQRL